jgi:superfamily II DNA/RNA helicase
MILFKKYVNQFLIIHLVATDVASKGLDFPDIQHVIIKRY